MKKNYSSPAIEVMAVMLSSMILDSSPEPLIQEEMYNPFGASKRRTQPF